MPEDCKEKFQNCVYIERNAEISTENNDLREENIGCPRILVLYQLPRNRKEWVEVLEDKTVLRKRAWWFSLNGAKTVANKESVRIKIPETQILSPDELVILMNRVKKGELL